MCKWLLLRREVNSCPEYCMQEVTSQRQAKVEHDTVLLNMEPTFGNELVVGCAVQSGSGIGR